MRGERIAVVTGGGTGIGLATVQLLAGKGWQVTAIGLECADDFPRNARFVEADVTDADALRALFGDIERLDALVTAAGAIQFAEEWQPAVFDKIMRVNVTGVLACAEAAGEALRRASGAIVTLASMWSWFGNPVAPRLWHQQRRRGGADPRPGGGLGRARDPCECRRPRLGRNPYLRRRPIRRQAQGDD